MTPSAVELAKLIANQFRDVGHCYLDADDNVRFDVQLTDNPGVYAFTVVNEIHYIGSSQDSLRGRFQSYIRLNNTTGKTWAWLRPNIENALRSGKPVRVLVLPTVPMSMETGLPIDQATGLESALIKALKPPWNRRGK